MKSNFEYLGQYWPVEDETSVTAGSVDMSV